MLQKIVKYILFLILALFVIAGLFYGNWVIKNKINWSKSITQSDISPLYSNKTNGVDNKTLTDIARNYLRTTENLSFDGKDVKIYDPKLLLIGFNTIWFFRHAPEDIRYDSKTGYVIVWRFMPGCEKKIENNALSSNWYSPDGFLCLGGWSLVVIVDDNLKPQKINIGALN